MNKGEERLAGAGCVRVYIIDRIKSSEASFSQQATLLSILVECQDVQASDSRDKIWQQWDRQATGSIQISTRHP